MGVFAHLLGRSKTTQEASAAKAQVGTEPGEALAEQAEEAAQDAAAKGPAADGRAGVAAGSGTVAEAHAAEAGIPRQQSAQEAADSENGKGART